MAPTYEVTAVWTERYTATLRVEADNEEAAREAGRRIWRDQALDFLGNAEFVTSRLLGFEVRPWVEPDRPSHAYRERRPEGGP